MGKGIPPTVDKMKGGSEIEALKLDGLQLITFFPFKILPLLA